MRGSVKLTVGEGGLSPFLSHPPPFPTHTHSLLSLDPKAYRAQCRQPMISAKGSRVVSGRGGVPLRTPREKRRRLGRVARGGDGGGNGRYTTPLATPSRRRRPAPVAKVAEDR
ncbi:hypothetical protein MTO96_017515 [Rhipicephalus appendiculatus]